jgi:hypothetical protein
MVLYDALLLWVKVEGPALATTQLKSQLPVLENTWNSSNAKLAGHAAELQRQVATKAKTAESSAFLASEEGQQRRAAKCCEVAFKLGEASLTGVKCIGCQH